MSIEMFAGKRKQAVEPKLPPTPTLPVQHDERTRRAADALTFVSELQKECDWLRNENQRLRADLNIAMLRCGDVEKAMTDMRNNLEMYRRYSVEVRSHLQTVRDVVDRAHNASLEASERSTAELDKSTEQMIADTERELGLAAEEIGKRFGANTNKDTPQPPPAATK